MAAVCQNSQSPAENTKKRHRNASIFHVLPQKGLLYHYRKDNNPTASIDEKIFDFWKIFRRTHNSFCQTKWPCVVWYCPEFYIRLGIVFFGAIFTPCVVNTLGSVLNDCFMSCYRVNTFSKVLIILLPWNLSLVVTNSKPHLFTHAQKINENIITSKYQIKWKIWK